MNTFRLPLAPLAPPHGPHLPPVDTLASLSDHLDRNRRYETALIAQHADDLIAADADHLTVMLALAGAEQHAVVNERPAHAARTDAYAGHYGLRGWYRHTGWHGEHLVIVNKLRTPDDGDVGRYFYHSPTGGRGFSVIDRDTGEVVARTPDQDAADEWIGRQVLAALALTPADERAKGEAAERVATAASELASLRTARDNNQRQVDAATEILAGGGLRPRVATNLRAGCERLTHRLREQDARIVEREKALAEAVAEWKAGPKAPEPAPAAPVGPVKTLAEERAERAREQDAFFERLRVGAAAAEGGREVGA